MKHLLLAALLAAPIAAHAQDAAPTCPSLPEMAKALKEAAQQTPVAAWVNQDGTTMQMFADPAGQRMTLVLVAGGCAFPVQQGALLKVFAVIGGGEA